jgi:hypothetical protein
MAGDLLKEVRFYEFYAIGQEKGDLLTEVAA